MRRIAPSKRTGFTVLELLAALTIIAILLALLIPAVQRARESSRRNQCRANLRAFGLAVQNYETAQRHFPSSVGFDESRALGGSSGAIPDQWLSPHVLLLPHLDQSNVYEDIMTGDSPTLGGNPAENVYEGARVVLPAFLCPSDGGELGNNYRVCTGSTIFASQGDGAFSGLRGRDAADISDGLSNTVAASESVKSDSDFSRYSSEDYWATSAGALKSAPDTDAMVDICASLTSSPPAGFFYPFVGFTWGVFGYDFTWYNHAVGPNSAVPNCTTNGPQSLTLANWSTSIGGVHKASSRHSGGVNVVFLDGSVKFVGDSVDLGVWRALATRDGNETVSQTAF